MSLSTGTSVSQFVSHPRHHTDMLCMALGESLTGVSYVQIDDPPAGPNGSVCVVIVEGLHRWGCGFGNHFVKRVDQSYR